MSLKFVKVLGFRVFNDELNKIDLNTNKAILTTTISPNSYGISTKNIHFKNALKNSDYIFLDGVYFSLASIFLNYQNIKKNQGPDIFNFFIKHANNNNLKVFFLGGSENVLNKLKNRLNTEYPNISSCFFSPPFKSKLSPADNNIIIKKINDFKPFITFVAMTCPKQESWSNQNKNKLDTKIIIPIGAAFDWFAGTQKTISPFWWKLRLAWLKRTIDRPEILKRYPNIGIFFWHLILAVLRIKK
jgi:N-acetylglucosaminyldiphosphoundecaprenol N-acetyl-beta-D-mannosaminyltransferase